MRLHSLTLCGIAPHYRTPQTLDLSQVRGPVVAIAGPNGSGKSTLCGTLRAALYRKFTSGSLADLATAADSYVGADFEIAKGRFVVTQRVNGVSRKAKGESSVRDEMGRDLLVRAQVSEYDRWAELNLPPWSLLAASTFSAQGERGLLGDLTPQERREILFRALGLEQIEPLPGRCRERAAAARRRGEVIDGQLAVERPRADVAAAEANLNGCLAVRTTAGSDVAHAREDLADARARHAALVAAWDDAEAAKARRSSAITALNARSTERVKLIARIETARRDSAGAAEVDLAGLALEALQREVSQLETSIATSRMALGAARADAKRAEDASLAAGRAVDRASQRLAAADAARKALAEAEAAAAKLPEAEAAVAAALSAHHEAGAEVERLRESTLDVAGQRIEALRAGLVDITRCGDIDTARRYAADSIAVDDGTVRRVAEAPAARDAALAEMRRTGVAHGEAVHTRDTLRATSARAPDLRASAAAGDDAEAEIRTQTQARSDATREAERLRASAKHIADGLQTDEPRLADAKRRRDAAKTTAARGESIAAARATLDALEPQLAAAEDAVRAAEADLALAPEPPAAEPVPDVAAQERAVTDAQEALRRAEGAVAVGDQALADARAAAVRVADLEAHRRAIDEEISDAVACERTFVAMLQLSIDAAGPELAQVTNELLRGGFGDRYTVTVETKRIGDKGQEIEDCYVQVIDTANGYAGPASGLSGGQLVIVGTAVRCAVARIAARTSGIARPTLILDEAGAALEEPLVPAWIAMLRRAATLTGAEHVLVVSHNPEVWALADSVVRVNDGRIEVAA